MCEGMKHRVVLPETQFNLLASGEFLNGNYHGERSERFICFHCILVFVLPSVRVASSAVFPYTRSIEAGGFRRKRCGKLDILRCWHGAFVCGRHPKLPANSPCVSFGSRGRCAWGFAAIVISSALGRDELVS